MKKIVGIEQAVGGDGGMAKAQLGVEGETLKAEVSVTYPIVKIIEPATRAFDDAMDKLEAAIPGDWDKAILANAKASFKAELLKLLAE